MVFDPHSHIHMPQFDNDRTDVVTRMRQAQVTRAVVVATEEAEIEPVLKLAKDNEGIFGSFAVSTQDEKLPDLSTE